MKKLYSLICLLIAPAAFAYDANEFEALNRTGYVELSSEASNAYGNKQYDVAFPKFQRLACAGDKPAQYVLGRMFLSGQGVERDDLRGYLWIKLASEFDFPTYRSTAKMIEGKLTAEQRKATSTQAEDMRSRYGVRATNISCTQSSSSSYSSNMKDAVICTPQVQGMDFLLRRCDVADLRGIIVGR